MSDIEMKEIEGYPNYFITKDGRVWSRPRKNKGKGKSSKGGWRKLGADKDGYLIVSLRTDNKVKNIKVHRLVAQNFIPNPENKPVVNHLNGIKNDNRVENLSWATIKENNQHALDTGLKVITDELRSKLSQVHTGRPKSFEHKKRIGEKVREAYQRKKYEKKITERKEA